MERMWARAMGVVLVVSAVGTARGNLLQNGSLEVGASSTSATGWTLHSGDTYRETSGSYGYTDGAFPNGSYALKEFGSVADCFQSGIAVHGGVPYTLRGRFYHSSTQDVIDGSGSSMRMFMHVEWFDADGVSLQHDYTANHNGTSPADTWTTIELTVMAPAGADHATFHVESDQDAGGGSVFGDDFYFDYKNLLENAGVESGTSPTDIASWTIAFDSFRETTGAYGYTDGAFPDGSYGLKQYGGIADLYQTNVVVTGGADYQARAEFYHSSSQDVIASSAVSTRMFLHVEWFDAGGASLRHDYSANHNGLSPADVWTQVVMRVTSPLAAARATFHVETDSDTGGGSLFGDAFFLGQEAQRQVATAVLFQ